MAHFGEQYLGVVEERTTLLTYLGRDPRFDALRADPRFANLTRRIKLPS
jgi:hypothetical protein